MGLGNILGSLSPAFGMASGNGLFGKLPLNSMGQSGLFGLLGMLLSHGDKGSPTPAPQSAASMLPGTTLATPQPLTQMGGPTLGQAASALPGMTKPNPLQMLGSAMSSSGGGDYSAGLSASQAPPLAGSGGLQSILQALGIL